MNGATPPTDGITNAGYWRPMDPDNDRDDPTSPDPMDWPDGPDRRLALGHVDEPNVPGYCTCGVLAKACPVKPRRWLSPFA